MDKVESIFKATEESYRRAEQHLAEAEVSLRKLLARFLTAEIRKPIAVPVPEPVAQPRRREAPEIWGRVDELLARRRPAPAEKPEPAIS